MAAFQKTDRATARLWAIGNRPRSVETGILRPRASLTFIADRIVDHVFQWGPYEPADYGPQIDWEWDPRGDIEWVAAVYRFYWAPPLADAY